MKKIKIMLTAIMVVAGLSGALAFKAHKFGTTIYCSTTSTSGVNCLSVSNSTYTATTDTNVNNFCTSVILGTCSTRANTSVLN